MKHFTDGDVSIDYTQDILEEIYIETYEIALQNAVDLSKMHPTECSCTQIHPTETLKCFV